MAETVNSERRQQVKQRSISRALNFRLAVFLVILLVLAGGFFSSISNPGLTIGAQSSELTPSPDVNSGQALKQLRATEDALLDNYGWVDRKNGIVHIPISRAMDLILQRGLPTRSDDQQPEQEF